MIRTAPTFLALSALFLPGAAQTIRLHDGYSSNSGKIVTYTLLERADLDPATVIGAK